MKQILFAASALALSYGLPVPGFAASAVECQAIFERGDVHREGWIDGDETHAYFNAMKAAGLTLPADHDGRLSAPMFQAVCEMGVFRGLQQLHSKPKGPSYGG